MTHKNPIQIIYEDEALIIVNKRSGMLSVPDGAVKANDLVSILNQQIEREKVQAKALPCHRLDKETSGVMVFAKGRKAQQIVMDQFRQRKIKKTYIAFVHGRFKQVKGVMKSNMQGAWPYRKNEGNKMAITNFELINSASNFSILRIAPITGRTNQIRIQFRDCGHPLIGERRFTHARDWPIKFKRVALHAYSVEINHPLTNKRIDFSVPIPDDMLGFMQEHNIANVFSW